LTDGWVYPIKGRNSWQYYVGLPHDTFLYTCTHRFSAMLDPHPFLCVTNATDDDYVHLYLCVLNFLILLPVWYCLGGIVVSVLATGPKGCRFEPSRGDGFLRMIKICGTPSFG
jgi:hypothetical protein